MAQLQIDQEKVKISIREYIERIIDERDRLYDIRFKSAEEAVSKALAAAEKQTNQSFLASEKAIGKAEEAQREYNVRSNEFRGQLDDQAKTLMPRPESVTMFKSQEDKLWNVKNELDRNIDALKTLVEKNYENLLKEVALLRESRSAIAGKSIGISTSWSILLGMVALLGGLGTITSFLFLYLKK